MSLNKENIALRDDRIDDSDDDLFAALPDNEYLKTNSLCNLECNMIERSVGEVRITYMDFVKHVQISKILFEFGINNFLMAYMQF